MGTSLWLPFLSAFFSMVAWAECASHCLPLGDVAVSFHFPSQLPPFFSLLFPPASETCNDFHPMFFTHDRSFEEFFCICIQLLNKTWKEMRATSEDFNKVRGIWGRGISFLCPGRGSSPPCAWSLCCAWKENEDGCEFRWLWGWKTEGIPVQTGACVPMVFLSL